MQQSFNCSESIGQISQVPAADATRQYSLAAAREHWRLKLLDAKLQGSLTDKANNTWIQDREKFVHACLQPHFFTEMLSLQQKCSRQDQAHNQLFNENYKALTRDLHGVKARIQREKEKQKKNTPTEDFDQREKGQQEAYERKVALMKEELLANVAQNEALFRQETAKILEQQDLAPLQSNETGSKLHNTSGNTQQSIEQETGKIWSLNYGAQLKKKFKVSLAEVTMEQFAHAVLGVNSERRVVCQNPLLNFVYGVRFKAIISPMHNKWLLNRLLSSSDIHFEDLRTQLKYLKAVQSRNSEVPTLTQHSSIGDVRFVLHTPDLASTLESNILKLSQCGTREVVICLDWLFDEAEKSANAQTPKQIIEKVAQDIKHALLILANEYESITFLERVSLYQEPNKRELQELIAIFDQIFE